MLVGSAKVTVIVRLSTLLYLIASRLVTVKETKHFIGYSPEARENGPATGLQTGSGGNTLQFLFVF